MPWKLFHPIFDIFHWFLTVRFWFANTFANLTKFANHVSIWTNIAIFPCTQMTRDILTYRPLQIQNLLANMLLTSSEFRHFRIIRIHFCICYLLQVWSFSVSRFVVQKDKKLFQDFFVIYFRNYGTLWNIWSNKLKFKLTTQLIVWIWRVFSQQFIFFWEVIHGKNKSWNVIHLAVFDKNLFFSFITFSHISNLAVKVCSRLAL